MRLSGGVFKHLPRSPASVPDFNQNCTKNAAKTISAGLNTQLSMCIIKIVTFKGGHPIW